jgi:hypothetical protein
VKSPLPAAGKGLDGREEERRKKTAVREAALRAEAERRSAKAAREAAQRAEAEGRQERERERKRTERKFEPIRVGRRNEEAQQQASEVGGAARERGGRPTGDKVLEFRDDKGEERATIGGGADFDGGGTAEKAEPSSNDKSFWKASTATTTTTSSSSAKSATTTTTTTTTTAAAAAAAAAGRAKADTNEWTAPLQTLKYETRADGVGSLTVNDSVLAATTWGLKSRGYDLGSFVGSLANERGMKAYEVGSEFSASAAREGSPVQSARERELFEETLRGVKVPWKSGAQERLFGLRHAEQLRGEMKRGNPPMNEGATKAFYELMVKEEGRGYLLVVNDETARNIPRMKISPIFMLEQGEKYRMVKDYSQRSTRELHERSINENTNRSDDPEPTFGGTQLRILRKAFQMRREWPGKYIVAIKNDEEAAFMRVHMHLDHCAPFSFRIGTDLIGIPLRLGMGWNRSPAIQSCVASTIARLVSKTGANEVTETDLNFAVGYEPKTTDTRTIVEVPTDETTQPDPMNPFDPWGGMPVEDYIDDLWGMTFTEPASLMRMYAAALNVGVHRIFRRQAEGERAYRPEVISQKKLAQEGWFDTVRTSLGIEVDLTRAEVSVPPKKAKDLLQLLSSFGGETGSFDDMESLVGKLNHAALGVWAGPYFLRRLYDALQGLGIEGPGANRIRLDEAVMEELDFWRGALQEQVPVPLSSFVHRKATWRGASDACGTGMGGYWRIEGKYGVRDYCWSVPFSKELSSQFISASTLDGTFTVNTAELLAVVLNFEVLVAVLSAEGREADIAGSCPLSMCDNMSSCAWLEKKSSRGEKESLLMREFGEFVRLWKLNPVTHWCKGEDNTFADFMSRYMRNGGIKFGGVHSPEEACAWVRKNIANTNPIPFVFSEQVISNVRLSQRLKLLGAPFSRTRATPTSGMKLAIENGAGGANIVRRST